MERQGRGQEKARLTVRGVAEERSTQSQRLGRSKGGGRGEGRGLPRDVTGGDPPARPGGRGQPPGLLRGGLVSRPGPGCPRVGASPLLRVGPPRTEVAPSVQRG